MPRLLKGISALLAGLAIALIALPIVGLLWRSVVSGAWDAMQRDAILQAALLSLTTTTISLLVIIATGTPLAYALARRQFRGRQALNVLIELPIVLPPAVAGLALLVTFGKNGLLGDVLSAFGVQIPFTMGAVILAQIFVGIPFYVRAAQLGFSGIHPELEESAQVDGAAGWQVFWHVTLPLALRAMISGALLAWARGLGEFGATLLFAGSRAGETRTLPLLIYHIFGQDINAAMWTALLLVGVAILVAGATRFLAQAAGNDPQNS